MKYIKIDLCRFRYNCTIRSDKFDRQGMKAWQDPKFWDFLNISKYASMRPHEASVSCYKSTLRMFNI